MKCSGRNGDFILKELTVGKKTNNSMIHLAHWSRRKGRTANLFLSGTANALKAFAVKCLEQLDEDYPFHASEIEPYQVFMSYRPTYWHAALIRVVKRLRSSQHLRFHADYPFPMFAGADIEFQDYFKRVYCIANSLQFNQQLPRLSELIAA